MTLNEKDFEVFDIKTSKDKKTLTLKVRAKLEGEDLPEHGENNRLSFSPNPNFKKWRTGDLRNHLKSKGFLIKKQISCEKTCITNGNAEELENTIVYELETKTKVRQNEQSKPTTTKKESTTTTRQPRATKTTKTS